MQHQIKSYLKFLRNAKNEHGVHSPFVFDLVTKCFHATDITSFGHERNNKIQKTIAYLHLEEYFYFKVGQELPRTIKGLIVPSEALKTFSIDTIYPYCINESCLFIEDIHKTRKNEFLWKQLYQNDKITCSIETYNLGLLFFRKEQNKEHFILHPKKTILSHLFERIRFKL